MQAKKSTKKFTPRTKANWSRMPTLQQRLKPNKSLVYQQDVKGPELKDLTVANNLATFAVTAVFAGVGAINLIAQGVGSNQRIGRRALMKSIMIRYGFTTSATVGSFRILVVYDKQTNGAVPAVTDVLATTDFHSPMNLNNADRFVTVFDKMVNIQDINLDTLYRKVNLEVMFSGTGAAITDVASGSLLFMVAPAVAASTATISYSARIRYVDI